MLKKFINDLPGGDYAGFTSKQEVNDFINSQMTVQGQFLQCGTGANSMQVQLPGDSEFLFGVIIYDDSGNPFNALTLTINNKKRLIDLNQCFASRTFGDPAVFQSSPLPHHYVPVPTPLYKGKNGITVEYECRVEANLFIAFYFV